MIVEAPIDSDWDKTMQKLATLPLQQEWERHMCQFQDCGADVSAYEKWRMMERMFYLYE